VREERRAKAWAAAAAVPPSLTNPGALRVPEEPVESIIQSVMRRKQRRLQAQPGTSARAPTALSDYQADPPLARRKRGPAATLLVGATDRGRHATQAPSPDPYGAVQAKARLAQPKGAFAKRGSSPLGASLLDRRGVSLRA